MEMVGLAPRPPRRARCTEPIVFLTFIFPALAGFNFGFDIGAASGAVRSLTELTPLGTLGTSLLTSASLFGALAGSIVVFWAGDPLGRRRELLIGSALYLLGSLLSSLPSKDDALAFAAFGRTLYGLGIAFSMHAAPVYISEMAPPSMRGLLVSLKEGFIVGGIMIGFAASAVAEASVPPDAVWRTVWSLPALPAVLILGGMGAMPASPRWLLLRSKSASTADEAAAYRERAQASLRRIRRSVAHAEQPDASSAPAAPASSALPHVSLLPAASPTSDSSPASDGIASDGMAEGGCARLELLVATELREIEETLGGETGGGGEGGGGWAEILSARRALTAGLGLVMLQQLTGQPSVLYYQEAIFRDAGFGAAAASSSVIVAAAKLAATLATVLTVDRFGRRPLLFVGISMMLGALLVLAAAFALSHQEGGATELPDGLALVVVCALMLYVCGYQARPRGCCCCCCWVGGWGSPAPP